MFPVKENINRQTHVYDIFREYVLNNDFVKATQKHIHILKCLNIETLCKS